MSDKEATARIKINRLLESAGFSQLYSDLQNQQSACLRDRGHDDQKHLTTTKY